MSSSLQRLLGSASFFAGGWLGLGLLFLSMSLQAATFCINYSATPDVAALLPYDLSILSTDARVEVAKLRRNGHTSLLT